MTAIRNDRAEKNGEFSNPGNVYPFHLRVILAIGCAAALIYYVVVTFRWPMVWDQTVIHYVNFLMAHGWAPYRDIYDMNLPGIYLIDGWQMHLFGPGDLAFRLYDFFLMGSLLTAMIAIALPYDWLGGMVAAAVFILFHAGDTPRGAGERDEVIAVLLMAGYALLFHAVRRKQSVFLLPFGVCAMFALSIKPTFAPFIFCVAIMALYVLKKRGEALSGYLIYGLVGVLIPTGLILNLLLRHHSIPALLDLSTRLTPYYAGIRDEPVVELLRYCLTFELKITVILAGIIVLFNREWIKNWERWAVLLGIAGGLFSFVIQRKGFPYQKYPLLAFLLLWVCMEFTRALHKRGGIRWVGVAGLIYATLYLVPLCRPLRRSYPEWSDFMQSLQSDLVGLGGDRLQHQVQCLDMVDGCLGALYHLNLVQSTGFTGDALFFLSSHSPAADYYRGIFLNDVYKSPPKVFVVSDEQFNGPSGFNKINNWPVFARFLNRNYTLTDTRVFSQSSYEIYVRKDAPPSF
jgi:hypothetical protein